MSKTIRTKPIVKRTYKVLEPIQADGRGSIRISCGKCVEVCQVQTFPAFDGTATGACLTKADGTVYDVCVSQDKAETTCSCPGHSFHQQGKPCKHLACLADMASKGNLPLPIVTTEEDELDWLDAYELACC